MATELEALVGHLFIVGGRAIKAASPGAIAMPPPRRTARGRDADTFFALLALGEGQRQPASFYEDLVEQISSKYFKVTGSVTSVLREAAITVNASLLKVNANRSEPLEVGLGCAVLRGQELYIGVTALVRCFLVHEGRVEYLPTDEELEEGTLPLGVHSDPDVRFYSRQVSAGDFLILADTSLDHLRDATICQALESGDVESALNNLRGVAGDFTTAQVIKFVEPLLTDEIETASSPRRPVVPSLPHFDSSRQLDASAETKIDESTSTSIQVGESAEKLAEQAVSPLQKVGRDVALGLAGATAGVRTLVERASPEEGVDSPPEQRFYLSTAMQIGVAIAVAVIVALLTTAVYRLRGQTSQYAQLVREAQGEIEQARVAGNDQAAARPHWETAVFLLAQASELRTPGPEVADLRSEALAVLDSYDHVTRVTPVLLREYEPGAVLRGPVVQGLNLYLIDTTGDIFYREDLDESGTGLARHESQIITRQGDLVGSQVVGGLIDLVWIEDGGVPQRNVLAVLSRNGLLITYSPSWDVTAAILPGFEAWQDPRAVAVYNRDLYILDAGANEIWRYQAGADSYSSTPQRYFTDVAFDLSDAIDMEIDSNGNVYLLHAHGQITKYFFGRQQDLTLEGLPQPITRPTALFLNMSLYDRAFFIADPGGGRLYTVSPTGAFLYNYKDSDDVIFDALSGVFNTDRPPLTYITSGNRLYYFARQ